MKTRGASLPLHYGQAIIDAIGFNFAIVSLLKEYARYLKMEAQCSKRFVPSYQYVHLAF